MGARGVSHEKQLLLMLGLGLGSSPSAGSRNHTWGKAAPTWRAGNLTSSSSGCLVASGPWVAPGPSGVHAVALSQPISRSRYDYIALIL